MTRAGASVRNVRKIVTLDLTAVMCYIHEPCNNHNRVREKKTKINSIDSSQAFKRNNEKLIHIYTLI